MTRNSKGPTTPTRSFEPLKACTDLNGKIGSVLSPVEIAIDEIVVDPNLQCRAALCQTTLNDYEEFAREADGWPFPPVVLVGRFLVDGFHRIEIAKRLGLETIPCTQSPGAREDALRAACGANSDHGLRRNNADKRRSINAALEAWPHLSNREIAKLTGVSHSLVNQMRTGNKVKILPLSEDHDDFNSALLSGNCLVQKLDESRMTFVFQAEPSCYRVVRIEGGEVYHFTRGSFEELHAEIDWLDALCSDGHPHDYLMQPYDCVDMTEGLRTKLLALASPERLAVAS